MRWTDLSHPIFPSSRNATRVRSLRSLVKSEFWLVHFILNTTLRFQIEDPARQLIFGFPRRAQAAVDEYQMGQVSLARWVGASREDRRISDVLRALRHLEAFLGFFTRRSCWVKLWQRMSNPTSAGCSRGAMVPGGAGCHPDPGRRQGRVRSSGRRQPS